MADQAGSIESRVAALEGRVARLEATGAAPQPSTHVVYHVGMPPCAAAQAYMPPCVCGFSSHSVQKDEAATPTPADFSKLGE
jgi:hypothetical protein